MSPQLSGWLAWLAGCCLTCGALRALPAQCRPSLHSTALPRCSPAPPRVRTVVFDKTGTLTAGRPQVVGVLVLREEVRAADVVGLAAAVEAHSEHPMARAILALSVRQQEEQQQQGKQQAAGSGNPTAQPASAANLLHVRGVAVAAGKGISGWVQQGTADAASGGGGAAINMAALLGDKTAVEVFVSVGNERHMAEAGVALTPAAQAYMRQQEERGCTCVLVAAGTALVGVVAVQDPIKPEARWVGAGRCCMGVGPHKGRVAEMVAQVAGDVCLLPFRPAQLLLPPRLTAHQPCAPPFAPHSCRGVVSALHQMGLRCVLLTGDNRRTAQAIGDQVRLASAACQPPQPTCLHVLPACCCSIKPACRSAPCRTPHMSDAPPPPPPPPSTHPCSLTSICLPPPLPHPPCRSWASLRCWRRCFQLARRKLCKSCSPPQAGVAVWRWWVMASTTPRHWPKQTWAWPLAAALVRRLARKGWA